MEIFPWNNFVFGGNYLEPTRKWEPLCRQTWRWKSAAAHFNDPTCTNFMGCPEITCKMSSTGFLKITRLPLLPPFLTPFLVKTVWMMAQICAKITRLQSPLLAVIIIPIKRLSKQSQIVNQSKQAGICTFSHYYYLCPRWHCNCW